jgi:hypothetical protein
LQKEQIMPITKVRSFRVDGPRTEEHLGLKSRYHVLSHVQGQGFVENLKLPTIVLDEGTLIIGSVPVPAVKVTADHFTWVQQSPGRYTSGHLYTLHGGLSVQGVVYLGTSPSDATEHAFLGTAVKPCRYTTLVTKKTYDATTDPTKITDADWEAGPALEISYETGLGETKPKSLVKLGGVDLTPQANQDLVTWSVDQKGRTVLGIHADDATCMFYPDLPKLGSLSFDPMSFDPVGWGSISQLCKDSAPLRGSTKFWKAVPVPRAVLRAAPALETIYLSDVLALTSDSPLDLKELVGILPDESVGTESQVMFVRNMKWAMGQDETEKEWLINLLGEEPPIIDEDDQKKLVAAGIGFYRDRFSKAYLASAFQRYVGPNSPEHKLNEKQEKKLKAFLSEGLAKDKDYNNQHQGIFVDAFKKTHPRLKDYINDKSHNWADELYKKLTDGAMFTLMVNRVAGCLGDKTAMTPLNNFACLLTALDATGTKAKDYFNAVVTGVIQQQVPKVLHTNKDDLMQWLPDALLALLRNLAEGGHEREGISKKQAEEMYQFYLKHSSELTSTVGDLILSLKSGSLIQKAMEFEERAEGIWSSVAGGFAKIGKLFLAIGWVGGCASVIMTFARGIKAEWKAMTDPQKAEFVTNIGQIVISAFDAVPVLWNGMTSLMQKGLDFARSAWIKLMEQFEEPWYLEMLSEIGSSYAQYYDMADFIFSSSGQTEPLLSKLLIAEGQEAEEAVVADTMYGRLFGKGIGTGVLKIFGAVVAVAMAGWSLWTLIDDIKKNGSVTTVIFDSLIFAANLLAAACLVVNLFVGGAALPIAGAILALLGVILSFLAGYLEKPANPLDQWMVKYGIPFVDGLEEEKPPTLALRPVKFDVFNVGLAVA